MSKNKIAPEGKSAALIRVVDIWGLSFMGSREVKKVAGYFEEIGENEKAAANLLGKTARAYYEAGNVLTKAIRRFDYRKSKLTLDIVANATGFPQRRVTLALKIFRAFENNPAALDSLALRDVLKLIAPPPPAGEEGYNRVDLGGNPGQGELDFGELFNLPASANQSLKNYRTIGDMLSEIVVVRRTGDNRLISKRFAQFSEDIPQNSQLRMAYKIMAQKTQAAIEDYLAAMEQEEGEK